MRFVATADLHLTDRKRDEYRWAFLDWLEDLLKDRKPDALFILGDLTDAKDRHPARLVNRIVKRLRDLNRIARVWILKGNHDYADPDCPFFQFLRARDQPAFVSAPEIQIVGNPVAEVAFVPHGYDLDPPYMGAKKLCDLVLCHHMVRGAKLAGSFKTMDGVELPKVKQTILSGDVHIPQRVGPLVYVGAPYPIDFGDVYPSRVIVGDTKAKNGMESIPVPSIQRSKIIIEDPRELRDSGLAEGDQLKIIMRLPRSEFSDWDEHRSRTLQIAKEIGCEVFGIELVERSKSTRVRLNDPPAPVKKTPVELLKEYAKSRNVPSHILDAGLEVLQS